MLLPSVDQIQAKLKELTNVQPLAQGGQKTVFQANHSTYGEIALKIILSSLADERTEREIEVSTKYHFSNVPTLYKWGIFAEEKDERIVYLMEQFIHGKTLRKVFVEQKTLGVTKTLELLKVLLTLAVELESQKLVHRDIKPENIMLDAQEEFWVLDFGIARHLEKASITLTGAPFGPHTIGYAAPEQFRNYKKEVDIRADLFSIGVVVYEALSGINPFYADARSPLDVLYRTETVLPSPLLIAGDSQRQLSGLIGILMEKFPSRRPLTAEVAMNWFESLLSTIKQ